MKNICYYYENRNKFGKEYLFARPIQFYGSGKKTVFVFRLSFYYLRNHTLRENPGCMQFTEVRIGV